MKYLILITDPTTQIQSACYTDWYTYENLYNPNYKMIVIDTISNLVSFDGKTWKQIEIDHL